MFQIDEMPCSHVMTAIKKGQMDAYEYCLRYYKKKIYLASYKYTVNSVENPEEWKIPEEIEKIEVEAPIEKRTTGRP